MTGLNSMQRVRKAMELQKADVVPVGPFIGNHAAKVSGTKIKDYYSDGKKMAEAQLYTWEKYGHDIIFVQSDNYYIAEGFGIKATYHENAIPTLSQPAIESLKDVSKLSVPNPWTDGRMPVYLNAIKIISEQLGDEIVIRGSGTGPFSLASHLIGTEKFLMELANAQYGLPEGDEPAIMHLMELTTEALFQFFVAQLEAGATILHCGDSLASLDVISPATYEKYVYPFEKKLFSRIKEYNNKYNAYTLLHICGDTSKVFGLMADLEVDCFEADYKVDLKLCKEKLGDKMCIIGNVNPSEILLRGSVEDVEKAAAQCIEDAGINGGFILGSGCEVPLNTPEENIKALVKIARQYKYE